jgi:predicted dehydrogenase
MSTTYKAGVIGRTGQGDYGHGLDVAFADLPNVELIAIADPDAAGLQAAGQRTEARQLYSDYRAMLPTAAPMPMNNTAKSWLMKG